VSDRTLFVAKYPDIGLGVCSCDDDFLIIIFSAIMCYMNYIVILGLAAAALTTFSSLPQVIRIIKIKETRDISLGMYILVVVGIILWLVYGLLIGDLPLIAANVVSLILTATILCLKIKYK